MVESTSNWGDDTSVVTQADIRRSNVGYSSKVLMADKLNLKVMYFDIIQRTEYMLEVMYQPDITELSDSFINGADLLEMSDGQVNRWWFANVTPNDCKVLYIYPAIDRVLEEWISRIKQGNYTTTDTPSQIPGIIEMMSHWQVQRRLDEITNHPTDYSITGGDKTKLKLTNRQLAPRRGSNKSRADHLLKRDAVNLMKILKAAVVGKWKIELPIQSRNTYNYDRYINIAKKLLTTRDIKACIKKSPSGWYFDSSLFSKLDVPWVLKIWNDPSILKTL